jgi:hypothetical protein
MKTKICQGCSKEFRQFIRIDGKALNLSKRSYCLDCSPYGSFIKNKKEIINNTRQCLRCQVFKPLEQFKLRGKSKPFRSCCKPCEGERIREYGQTLKRKAVEYLGGKCLICGYSKSMRALTFHHRNPKEKSFSLAKRKCLNWPDTQRELDKCDLLCANCHSERHDDLFNSRP